MPRSFTLDDARNLPYVTLLDRCHALLVPFEATESETHDELEARISRTLDQCPDVYAWFLQLRAYFDHWTDSYGTMFGMKSDEYRGMRQRRDAMKEFASAAKLRYEGTSRRLTQLQAHEEESRLARGR